MKTLKNYIDEDLAIEIINGWEMCCNNDEETVEEEIHNMLEHLDNSKNIITTKQQALEVMVAKGYNKPLVKAFLSEYGSQYMDPTETLLWLGCANLFATEDELIKCYEEDFINTFEVELTEKGIMFEGKLTWNIEGDWL